MTGLRILDAGGGSLPAVACLHGAGGHAGRFERLNRVIEPRRRVLAHDLRGHGRSPWAGEQTAAAHAGDLGAVLRACGVEQTALIGEGLGGLVAIEFAAEYGNRVTALVLLDPPLSASGDDWRRRAAAERAGRSFERVDEAIAALRLARGSLHAPTVLLEQEAADHLVSGEDGRFRWRYSGRAVADLLESIASEPPPRLREVACPVLIVHAAGSDRLAVADAELAVTECRRGELVSVPGGHPVLWDALAETGAAVRDFVLARAPAA